MKNDSSPRPRLTFTCPENWNQMDSSENGKYCGKCGIVVTDFSKMNDVEILSSLKKTSNQHSCGSFKAYQLQEPFNDKRNNLVRFYQLAVRLPKRNYFVRSFQLALATVLLMATGCHRRLTGYTSKSDVRHFSKQGGVENVSSKSLREKK